MCQYLKDYAVFFGRAELFKNIATWTQRGIFSSLFCFVSAKTFFTLLSADGPASVGHP
jgi:hypothetical protein